MSLVGLDTSLITCLPKLTRAADWGRTAVESFALEVNCTLEDLWVPPVFKLVFLLYSLILALDTFCPFPFLNGNGPLYLGGSVSS